MSQELVKKEATNVEESDGLTAMQRRFCDYLIFNEGRTTHQDAALKAGYAEVGAKQEAYRLLRNPKVQTYIAKSPRKRTLVRPESGSEIGRPLSGKA